jgi:hypothetical protein
VGGTLYAKTGYKGVFGVGIALVVVDFIMRLLMIEKGVAARFINSPMHSSRSTTDSDCEVPEASESTPLLPDDTLKDSDAYRLQEPQNWFTKTLPILLVLKDPSLLTALFIGVSKTSSNHRASTCKLQRFTNSMIPRSIIFPSLGLLYTACSQVPILQVGGLVHNLSN